jgi:hypothetical protein
VILARVPLETAAPSRSICRSASLKAALDIDWSDPAAQASEVARWLAEVDGVEHWAATHVTHDIFTTGLPTPSRIVSRNDVGVRIEGTDVRTGKSVGTLVVRVNGEWIEVGGGWRTSLAQIR